MMMKKYFKRKKKKIKHKIYNLNLAYNNYRCHFEVLDEDKICDTIPSSDVAGRLYTGEIIVLDSKLVAMETHLGWTLSGKLPEQTTEGKNLAMIVFSQNVILLSKSSLRSS
uniref:Uncharacterized protein n=1 Tax=Cacopsylla melanoneura TaxID=428564 RepID=A0A8D8TVJ8_9HEMI